MGHKYVRADVERAVARYRDLTGDAAATLTRTEAGKLVVYRVENSAHLRGFAAYGAFSAWSAVEQFCNGWEAGFAQNAKRTQD